MWNPSKLPAGADAAGVRTTPGVAPHPQADLSLVTHTGQAQVCLDGNGLKRKRLEQGGCISIPRCW